MDCIYKLSTSQWCMYLRGEKKKESDKMDNLGKRWEDPKIKWETSLFSCTQKAHAFKQKTFLSFLPLDSHKLKHKGNKEKENKSSQRNSIFVLLFSCLLVLLLPLLSWYFYWLLYLILSNESSTFALSDGFLKTLKKQNPEKNRC